MIERGEDYQDLGVVWFDQRRPAETWVRQLTKRLIELDFEVILTPADKAWHAA